MDPVVVVERFVGGKLYIDATQTHFISVNTGEIGFTADPGSHAAVQRVVPDVEFPDGGCIDCGDKVAGTVGGRDDEFVCSDSIEAGHGEIGQFVSRASLPAGCSTTPGAIGKFTRTIMHQIGQGESPATVAVADNATLFLSPFEDWLSPRRPFIEQCCSWIVVFNQFEQAQVSCM